MASITEQDQKMLEQLGLQDIAEEEKRVVLDEIDEKMTKRFIANLLVSLEPEKAAELEAEVEKIPSENTEEIISKIIEMHPDAAKVLQESAKQIVDELKAGKSSQTEAPQAQEQAVTSEENRLNQSPARSPIEVPSSTEPPADFQPPTPSPLPSAPDPAPSAPDPYAGPAIPTPTPSEPPSANVQPPAEESGGLPVPQEEAQNPFGSEIKMVGKEETQPVAFSPAPPAPDPYAGPAIPTPTPSEPPSANVQPPADQPVPTDSQPQDTDQNPAFLPQVPDTQPPASGTQPPASNTPNNDYYQA